MPFGVKCECKESPSECDVVYLMRNQTPSAVVVAIHYLALHGLYGGYTAVVYSVFFISLACELPGTERAVGGVDDHHCAGGQP